MAVKFGCCGNVNVNAHVTVTLKYSDIFLGKAAIFGSHSLPRRRS